MKTAKKTLLSVVFVIAMIISIVAISNITASAQTTDTNTLEASPAYICGDVDLDSKITISDATLVQRYLAKLVELDDIQLKL